MNLISSIQKYYQPDKNYFDPLLYPQRECHKYWVQLFSSSRDLSSCERLTQLAMRVVCVVPLILATLISYVIGVAAIVLKGCTKTKKSSEEPSPDIPVSPSPTPIIHLSVPSSNPNPPVQPVPSAVVVRKNRDAWLASVDHDLFALKPLTELMQSYLGVGYLVKIHRYSSPNSGDFFRDRYLSVPRYSGCEFGFLEETTRKYPGLIPGGCIDLKIRLVSHISDVEGVAYLNDLSLSIAWTSLGLGALNPRNIELSYAYVELVKVLENNQFREPQKGEKIDTEALSCIDE